MLRKKLNDPKKLAAKVKKAAKFCQQIIDAAIGGKKAGKVKQIIDDYSAKRSTSPEANAYMLAGDVGDDLI